MRGSGAMTTCVPVRLDQSDWQSAVFFELGGVECKQDRNILSQSNQTFPISLEADLIESATASVVMLRFEIMTNGDNPLAGEVLVVPGMGSVQFDTMKNLTEQQSLGFFFSDGGYNLIHSQQLLLQDRERQGYKEILEQAVSHDAVIRLTGRYNGIAGLKEVVANYAKRVSREP